MSAAPPGTFEAKAHAKLNLFLHVVGRRPDSYHLLDSLIAFASVHDTVAARPGRGLTLKIDGPFGVALSDAGGDNLVLKAARGLAALTGRDADAALTLTKRLPIASGIGGGSTDAAATLRVLSRLWRVSPEPAALRGLALSLGADVPMCLEGLAARVGGIGEEIDPVSALPEIGLLLVNPLVAVPTPAVFKARRGDFSNPAGSMSATASLDDLVKYLSGTRNDLEAPARAIAPVIDDVLSAIGGLAGCHLARMSGSGATCFGLFASEELARHSGDALALTQPHWWVAPGRLLSDTISCEAG
ncbi:MAG: 4-(cytidine 5'-diphospho)-2-C-methyl-D-erythritol kinase [Alphaproteobacteria bacterium]|nr:4-(cytidine 5'-diphospho)-2-C-methyl-D-erythritol kinase [Alphaproteobacteria bacterium]